MSHTEDLADALARDVIAAMADLGDDTLVTQVSKLLAASSTAMQEAFMAAIRAQMAEARARKFLDDLRAKHRVL